MYIFYVCRERIVRLRVYISFMKTETTHVHSSILDVIDKFEIDESIIYKYIYRQGRAYGLCNKNSEAKRFCLHFKWHIGQLK